MSEDFEAPKDDLDKELPAGSEEHSDYKPADAKDANIKHQLSGMYQNGFWTTPHTLYWNVPYPISWMV